jgi:hypothetical protein
MQHSEYVSPTDLKSLLIPTCVMFIGALDPVQSTIRTIDVGNSKIPRSMILNLINELASRSPLQGMALSKIGLTHVPYNVLQATNGTLLYLSLHGNIFRNLR